MTPFRLSGAWRFPRCWQILIRADGFNVQDEDGETLVGFYTVRRILAATRESAERYAKQRLWEEEKFAKLQALHEANPENRSRPSVSAEEVYQIRWMTYFFGSYCKGYVFYPE